jgi:hypothetical protein
MSGMTCEDVRAVAAEMALDVLPADERARVLDHLDDCPSCHELVDSFVRASDSMLVALPDAPVPAGVASAIRATRPGTTVTTRSGAARGWLVAAAAAVLLIVVAVAAVVSRDDSDGDGPDEIAAQLIAPAGGAEVGSISLEGGDDPWMWVTVAGLDDGTYRCEVEFADGTTTVVGRVVVTGGEGAWDAPIAVDVGDVREVHVVADDGTTVGTAMV